LQGIKSNCRRSRNPALICFSFLLKFRWNLQKTKKCNIFWDVTTVMVLRILLFAPKTSKLCEPSLKIYLKNISNFKILQQNCISIISFDPLFSKISFPVNDYMLHCFLVSHLAISNYLHIWQLTGSGIQTPLTIITRIPHFFLPYRLLFLVPPRTFMHFTSN
jgi:hypothetical protein